MRKLILKIKLLLIRVNGYCEVVLGAPFVPRRSASKAIVTLTGLKVNGSQVLGELLKVRWAHIATHGFFANAEFRSKAQMQLEDFSQRLFVEPGERKTIAGRNPLVLSGLVLA